MTIAKPDPSSLDDRRESERFHLNLLLGFKRQLPDSDPVETREWLEALDGVVESQGRERADFLLRKVRDDSYRQCVVAAIRAITGARAQIAYVLDEPPAADDAARSVPAPPTEDEWVRRFVAEFDAEEIHPEPDPPATPESEA